ncbi:MAG: hypothetical protein ABRQ38_06810 [Candidatus Eremiobacterota bacterium]
MKKEEFHEYCRAFSTSKEKKMFLILIITPMLHLNMLLKEYFTEKKK